MNVSIIFEALRFFIQAGYAMRYDFPALPESQAEVPYFIHTLVAQAAPAIKPTATIPIAVTIPSCVFHFK